ncbi:MAG TPA: type II toxin-antitoxin system HicA family toxin [Thermoanaerobaculia bacterium]|nr:type II toxin-antitoxin system HicA family toxin [Thermoanaerobaculia bacterium]
MAPRLPRISGAEVIQALSRLGFKVVRQRGSHVVLRKDSASGAVGCAVPLHKELALGTLHGILKQAKVSIEELMNNL